jgi:hypothetical protein
LAAHPHVRDKPINVFFFLKNIAAVSALVVLRQIPQKEKSGSNHCLKPNEQILKTKVIAVSKR